MPAAGDDEIFLDTLACAAGQQAADLLQGLAEFHGEKIVAHQAADRLAQEQVAGEGPEQGVGERVAMDDADGTPLFVEDRQGVQVGLAAEDFHHFLGRGANVDRALFQQQRTQVAVLVAGRLAGGASAGQHLLYVARRVFLRAAEQIALHQVDPHLAKHRQFLGQFDAFGDDLGARGSGHLQDGADELAFHGVQVDAVDEVAVDLHVVWTQFRPQAQAGVASAEVVEGDGEAHGAIVVQRGVEQVEVVDGGLFGQFDHHPVRRDPQLLQQLQGAAGRMAGFEEGLRRDVEEQHGVALDVAEAAEGALSAEQFQFAQPSALAGHGEQRQGRVQRAVGRTAG